MPQGPAKRPSTLLCIALAGSALLRLSLHLLCLWVPPGLGLSLPRSFKVFLDLSLLPRTLPPTMLPPRHPRLSVDLAGPPRLSSPYKPLPPTQGPWAQVAGRLPGQEARLSPPLTPPPLRVLPPSSPSAPPPLRPFLLRPLHPLSSPAPPPPLSPPFPPPPPLWASHLPWRGRGRLPSLRVPCWT